MIDSKKIVKSKVLKISQLDLASGCLAKWVQGKRLTLQDMGQMCQVDKARLGPSQKLLVLEMTIS